MALKLIFYESFLTIKLAYHYQKYYFSSTLYTQHRVHSSSPFFLVSSATNFCITSFTASVLSYFNERKQSVETFVVEKLLSVEFGKNVLYVKVHLTILTNLSFIAEFNEFVEMRTFGPCFSIIELIFY